MLECIIPKAKHCKVYISINSRFIFNKLGKCVFVLLKDKQNVKFGGVVRCELYLHFDYVFSCIYMTQMLDSHLIHQYYTNPPFCNVLQIMTEKSRK